MITQEQIPAVLDHDVYDANGAKIGEVKHLFLDEATGRPEWLCVKTGLFGTKESFVPMRDAELVTDHVEVPYDKDRVKDAPNVDVDAGGYLSAEEERELYRYYGMDWESSWQQANQPGEGWAHEGGMRERERLGHTDTGDTGIQNGYADTGDTGIQNGYADTGDMGTETGYADTGMGRRGDAMAGGDRPEVGAETHERGRARLRKYIVTDE
ncbi:PRC-barrel domain-containing protein [Nonomuraea dietziae]|uniref:PRC-barrel domain-containing protein n=1 Tax=Nonomuraea dietziae TaxID=65515 RepID=UPI00343ABB2A